MSAFPAPSFLSPAAGAKPPAARAHTLSGGARRLKQLKRSLEAPRPSSKKPRVSQDSSGSGSGSGRRRAKQPRASDEPLPTRRLEFAPTPVKRARSASSSSSSASSSTEGEGSSDEAELAFDARTLGNIRVVREAQAQSPARSAASAASSLDSAPVGIEFQFNVASAVSSVAVSPGGDFLVAGFNNGNVFLYPMNKDAFRFRRGVLLDHFSARGMYTQLRLRVAIPDDGKFIFAGVYRGSMEIRAYEVDSIKFPTDDPEEIAAASARAAHDSDDSEDEADDSFGMPLAKAVSHTYSDAKLKGFGAVKSVFRPETNSTEYHLLCGLGIKNLHLWRFFQQPSPEDGSMAWTWECAFDKQTNGISLEYLSFHRSIPNRIISKSEHQNIRVWDLIEEHDGKHALTIKKQSHTDVKHTTDAVAVYDDHAYGGGESLAVVDLRTAARMELDLPLSAKEQRAQEEVAKSTTRVASFQRAWNPRGSRRRGGGATEDLNGMRHMRTVTQVAGRDLAPFTVGMCSDGSVFFHQPQHDGMGLATPLEYIEGYEQFFKDPSLDFQAQFSDLTRASSSGLLTVLPLPATKNSDDWLIVAANQDQLLVRSLKAFLHRSRQLNEYSKVKRGLRNVMRDLGQGASSNDDASSSSSSDSDGSDSDSRLSDAAKRRRKAQDVPSKTLKGPKKSKPSSSKAPARATKSSSKQESTESTKVEKKPTKREKKDKLSVDTDSKAVKATPEPKKVEPTNDDTSTVSGKKVEQPISTAPAVTTPRRKTGANNQPVTPNVASPVVSISSPSASSNPNTPEQPGLTKEERQAILLKELEWTPPNRSKQQASDTDKENEPVNKSNQTTGRSTVDTKGKKKTKACMKIESLFTANDDDFETPAAEVASTSNQTKQSKPKIAKRSRNSADADSVPLLEKESQIDNNKDTAMEVEDDDVDSMLDAMEASEPVFESFPLRSDGGLLLSAALFQYAGEEATKRDRSTSEFDAASFNDEALLLVHFARQSARLRTNFSAEKARVYSQLDCAALSASASAARSKGPNWKRGLSAEYSRRKHLKRRQKKQLAARLQVLHSDYARQIRELQNVQRLEADAMRARQALRRLASLIPDQPKSAM